MSEKEQNQDITQTERVIEEKVINAKSGLYYEKQKNIIEGYYIK